MATRAPRIRVAAQAGRRRAPGCRPDRAAAGQSTFPYHYELGNDELLVVVSGTPTLRAPDGGRELQPGDCILFPSGPDGAHKLTNRSDDVVRVLLVSNFALPRAAVRVDSGKMMLRWGSGRDERRWFFLGEDADYWDGEAVE